MSARRKSHVPAAPESDPYIRPLVVILVVLMAGYFLVGMALVQYAAERGVL